MKIYTYSGPLSGVTLDDGREVLLHPDSTVEMPEENEYVKTLEALGYLTEVITSVPAAMQPEETKKKAKEVADNAS